MTHTTIHPPSKAKMAAWRSIIEQVAHPAYEEFLELGDVLQNVKRQEFLAMAIRYYMTHLKHYGLVRKKDGEVLPMFKDPETYFDDMEEPLQKLSGLVAVMRQLDTKQDSPDSEALAHTFWALDDLIQEIKDCSTKFWENGLASQDSTESGSATQADDGKEG